MELGNANPQLGERFLSLAPIPSHARLQTAWPISESKIINCRCWSATMKQLLLSDIQHALFISCFSRLNKQTCMPRNATEIAKAWHKKVDFFCRGKLWALVVCHANVFRPPWHNVHSQPICPDLITYVVPTCRLGLQSIGQSCDTRR